MKGVLDCDAHCARSTRVHSKHVCPGFFYPKDPFQRLKKHSAPLTFEPVHTFHQNLSYSLYYLIVADNIHNL